MFEDCFCYKTDKNSYFYMLQYLWLGLHVCVKVYYSTHTKQVSY